MSVSSDDYIAATNKTEDLLHQYNQDVAALYHRVGQLQQVNNVTVTKGRETITENPQAPAHERVVFDLNDWPKIEDIIDRLKRLRAALESEDSMWIGLSDPAKQKFQRRRRTT